MEKIIFTDIHNPEGALSKPKPATEYIPDWYKNAKSYLSPDGRKRAIREDEPNEGVLSTIKRCMPLWDMLTAGYIIETPYDIYVHQRPEGPYFQWYANDAVKFQPESQLQNHPAFPKGLPGVRIQHPWGIETPKGWSILIMNPTHREETPIHILPGIVDTDTYPLPFNMFIILNDPSFEGMIPAGTPFAQIIPLKRESWVSELGKEKQVTLRNIAAAKMNTVFFDKYKKFWWSKKEYK